MRDLDDHPAINAEITVGGDMPIGHVVSVCQVPQHDGTTMLSALVDLDSDLLRDAAARYSLAGSTLFLDQRRVGEIVESSWSRMIGKLEHSAKVNWNAVAMSNALKAYAASEFKSVADAAEQWQDNMAEVRKAARPEGGPVDEKDVTYDGPLKECTEAPGPFEPITRNGAPVRMKELRKGDRFNMRSAEWVAADAPETVETVDGESWSILARSVCEEEQAVAVAVATYETQEKRVRLPLDTDTVKLVLVTAAISLASFGAVLVLALVVVALK